MYHTCGVWTEEPISKKECLKIMGIQVLAILLIIFAIGYFSGHTLDKPQNSKNAKESLK